METGSGAGDLRCGVMCKGECIRGVWLAGARGRAGRGSLSRVGWLVNEGLRCGALIVVLGGRRSGYRQTAFARVIYLD